ncbi:MAG: hypothetical protein K5764_03910 [Prevotella sp.]|nr:hypothetical protein [Prevotella sp.]
MWFCYSINRNNVLFESIKIQRLACYQKQGTTYAVMEDTGWWSVSFLFVHYRFPTRQRGPLVGAMVQMHMLEPEQTQGATVLPTAAPLDMVW